MVHFRDLMTLKIVLGTNKNTNEMRKKKIISYTLHTDQKVKEIVTYSDNRYL